MNDCLKKEIVVLVGSQGSGKTTICSERFKDHLRISRDDMGNKKHFDCFYESILTGVEKIVIDNTNPSRRSRQKYLGLAEEAGYKTKIFFIGQDREICKKRIQARKNHPTLAPNKADEALNAFYRNFQFPSKLEADEVEVLGPTPKFADVFDLTELLKNRRYLIVGDVHGCIQELKQLLEEREFDVNEDVLISVGDLVDRGENSKETVDFCMSLPYFFSTEGNHERKLKRYIAGENIKIGNGLGKTIEGFGNKFEEKYVNFFNAMPLIIKTPAGYVVHAGFDPLMTPEQQNERDCIFMRFYGGKDFFDDVNGQYWFKSWPKDSPKVFFGHEVNPKGFIPENTINLDGGCCFGGYLKAWDSRDSIVYYISAKKEYSVNDHKRGV